MGDEHYEREWNRWWDEAGFEDLDENGEPHDHSDHDITDRKEQW